MNKPVPHEPPVAERDDPAMPGFRSWRGIYLFVLGCFVLYVALLGLFTRAFS